MNLGREGERKGRLKREEENDLLYFCSVELLLFTLVFFIIIIFPVISMQYIYQWLQASYNTNEIPLIKRNKRALFVQYTIVL